MLQRLADEIDHLARRDDVGSAPIMRLACSRGICHGKPKWLRALGHFRVVGLFGWGFAMRTGFRIWDS